MSHSIQSEHLETLSVRGGLNQDQQFGCVVPPIYLSSTYNFNDYNEPRAHDYSRRGNPSRDLVQDTLAQLEGGAGAVVTSSGMSAIHLVCTVLLKPGDLLIAPIDCYGGSYRLFDSVAKRGAFDVLFIDQNDPEQLNAIVTKKPKVVLVETPSNPLLNIVDIQKISQLAHQSGAIVVADNTFLSPALQQPLKLGADIVVHSCTKYLNGHSDVVAGTVICKDPALAMEMAWWGNNIGVTGGAFDSYLLLRGIRTLVPRIKQQEQSAMHIATFLAAHPLIETVYYPGLVTHKGHELAKAQQTGFGAMLSFELKLEESRFSEFLNHLSFFTLAESLGGVESLISHTATMTHAGMSEEARRAAGIKSNLFRLSVGLEAYEDLILDLQAALDAMAD
ncbi:cystathionine gamma-synthase [Thorsellia anophelis]|uniref:Cystathionine gamma-synthase n=1 Tax=Thorsellia anophelis DSM 18579 TaxID=1123402 RepID=A0A1I0B7W5_9GAMM|nr:cystathionine gamma-synthase [Thorsellia anophelis]SET02139.1 cystathionine gamma-synthase [Thorsellia anophelis DSM 18579]